MNTPIRFINAASLGGIAESFVHLHFLSGLHCCRKCEMAEPRHFIFLSERLITRLSKACVAEAA